MSLITGHRTSVTEDLLSGNDFIRESKNVLKIMKVLRKENYKFWTESKHLREAILIGSANAEPKKPKVYKFQDKQRSFPIEL